MVISNPEGATSHAGTLQIDFLGWDANGRVLNCPYYAPCTCRCVDITDSSTNNRVYQSTNMVHLADGSLSYVTFEMAHDNFPITTIGTIINQGDLLGHTGTAGYVTGDHLHYQCARGTYAGWEQVPPDNNWQLVNEMHIYDACYVNDTVIIDGEGYNWRVYTGPIPPPTEEKKRKKFPWVLYANKFRERTSV
jgi:hypothetical protein